MATLPISKKDVDQFERDGFLQIKNVFPPEELEDLREKIIQMKSREQQLGNIVPADPSVPELTSFYGDLFGKPELSHLLLDDRILSVAKAILGDHIVYFGDSSCHIGKGYRGFHKDNVDRSDPDGPDWKGKYNVIRFGIYMQDHVFHSGGLKIRIGSHLKKGDIKGGKAIDVPIEAGDLLTWKLTTTHSGNAVKLKLLPHLTLSNSLENRVPNWLTADEQKERISVFFSFAGTGPFVERFVDYCRQRGDYNTHWEKSRLDADLLKEWEKRNIQFLKPSPTYGSKFSVSGS